MTFQVLAELILKDKAFLYSLCEEMPWEMKKMAGGLFSFSLEKDLWTAFHILINVFHYGEPIKEI